VPCLNFQISVAVLQLLSAIFAFAAAVLWFLSAGVKIPKDFSGRVYRAGSFPARWRSNGFPDSRVVGQSDNSELVELGHALQRQGSWSKWAAGCAFVAAALQGVATLAEHPEWFR
jgi:hypothetical protein